MSSPSEFRNLMSALSDGTLSRDGMDRLNRLLQSDPIAQEEYLDHMFLEGLLEREFGAVLSCGDDTMATACMAPSTGMPALLPERRFRVFRIAARWSVAVLATAAILMVDWLAWDRQPAAPRIHPLDVVNSGFESGLARQDARHAMAAWYGDEADVVERFSDVIPLEGNRMLRFVKSKVKPEDACELYQIVDLRGVSEIIANRPTSVSASAFFNGVPEDLAANDFAFGITVFAFSGDPSEHVHVWPMRWKQALTFSGSQMHADADVNSWQQVTAQLPLPADTEFLMIQLAVNRTGEAGGSEEFPGHFADSVAVNLVHEK